MVATERAGRKAVRIMNSIVNTCVLIVILLLLAAGCYAIWDSGQVYTAADAAQYQIYKPTAENKGLSFNQLRSVNPEVFSWLTVYGTHIDYPVTQGQDNLKYINTDAKGQYSLSGSIFLDAGCGKNFSDFSSIIYGHHMDKDAMFGEIGLFTDKSFFNAHEYGQLYVGGKQHGLEFFAFLHVDAYDTAVYRTKVTEQTDKQAYLDLLMKQAANIRADVTVTTADRIVLLSTCSEDSTNGRDILIGVITDKTYPDTFNTKITDTQSAIPVIGALPGFWAQASLPVKIIMIGLPCLLIVLLAVLIYTKRGRSKKARGTSSCKGVSEHEQDIF